MIGDADKPCSLRDPLVQAERRKGLQLPHMVPLSAFAARLRAAGIGEVPDFDPMDGGTAATFLFLFEKPGPMTSISTGRSNRRGSGYISRNNDDPTAEATFHFMLEAGVPRRSSVLWNTIPAWNGTRKITMPELQQGAASAAELVGLLPDLRAIVLVGLRAKAAGPLLSHLGLPILRSDHPSPLVRARWPERWRSIPSQWAQVHEARVGAPVSG